MRLLIFCFFLYQEYKKRSATVPEISVRVGKQIDERDSTTFNVRTGSTFVER